MRPFCSSWLHSIVTILVAFTVTTENEAVTLTELLKTDPIGSGEKLVALIRVPRNTPTDRVEDPGKRQARETGKYYPATRALKDEDQPIKDPGKRCINCDSRGSYSGSTGYDRGRGSTDRYYDPYSTYSSSRGRYDPYSRNDRDRYVDEYDRDVYRGRNRYSQYENYDPRERYYSGSERGYNRGLGYDYDAGGRERASYYDPYYRNRYDPYEDDYYTRGGYDTGYASRGYGGGRPDYYGGSAGYAKDYSYGGDRDRYGGGYGYGSSGYGTNSYTGSRSRYPTYDYDNGYRPTSYLYDRPSSTTADPPKNTDDDRNDTSGSSPNGNNRGN